MVSSEESYGPLVTTTVRVMTWNLWGRFGPWVEREAAVVDTLADLDPDIVALQECWVDDTGADQAAVLGERLGIDGQRGPFDVWSVALDWPLHASEARQHALRHLVGLVQHERTPSALLVAAGDLNAPPDSDEVRMLTGGAPVAAPGFVLRDAPW